MSFRVNTPSFEVPNHSYRPDRVASALLIAFFVLMALAAGAVVASGNLILIVLAIGLILGVILLSALQVTVWIILVGTLVVSGPMVLFVPQLSKIPWLFSMLGVFLLPAAFLVAGTIRHDSRRQVPGFFVIALIFLVYVAASLFLPESSFDEALPALKRQFQFWGLMGLLAVVPFTTKVVYRWGTFFIVLAMFQFPFALYERIALVPLRVNMPRRVVPIDIVAGTMEMSMFGGSSNSVMVFLLIVVMALLLSAYREGLLSVHRLMISLAVVAAPLGLGETKIVLVLLPLALFFVYSDLIKKRPVLFALGSAVTAGVMIGLFYTYLMVQNTDQFNYRFDQRVEQSISYNFGEEGYNGGVTLNRTTVFPFWWRQSIPNDPAAALVGHGLGSSYSIEGNAIKGHVERRYQGISIGLTAASILLWELGVIGFGLVLAVLGGAWVTARRLLANAKPGGDRVLCQTLLVSTTLLIVMLFYADFLVVLPSMEVIMAMTLGLIAWRWRSR